jgi:hypothetical protein
LGGLRTPRADWNYRGGSTQLYILDAPAGSHR